MASSPWLGGQYPTTRLRRNRRHDWSRRLVARAPTDGERSDLAGIHSRRREPADGHSLDAGRRAAVASICWSRRWAKPRNWAFPRSLCSRRPIPQKKSPEAEEAVNPENLVCRAVRAIKAAHGDAIGVMCDVALDPYTSHGHDGLLRDGYVVNDETVEVLCRQAVVQAEAGCDVIAPSDMMDGRIGAVRRRWTRRVSTASRSCPTPPSTPRRSTARSATRSARRQTWGGDKQTYQMDPANARRSAARSGLGHRRRRRHGDGQAGHALPGHRHAA